MLITFWDQILLGVRQQAVMKLCVYLSLLLGCVLSDQSAVPVQRISEGSDLTVPCENEGRVDWSKNANGKREIIFRVHRGEPPVRAKPDSDHRYSILANLSLVIKEAWVSDSGVYYCNATAVLNLTVMPLKARFDQRITEGSEITVPCENKGNVSWSKQVDGKREIILRAQHGEDPVRSKSAPDLRYSVIKNSTLVIKQVSESDSGVYYCNTIPVVNLTVMPLQGGASDGVSGAERVLFISLSALFFSLTAV